MRDDLNQMFLLLSNACMMLVENLRNEYMQANIEKPIVIENQINQLRDTLRLKNIENLKNGVYMHLNSNFFNDFVFRCEKIGDLMCDINDSLSGFKNDYNHL